MDNGVIVKQVIDSQSTDGRAWLLEGGEAMRQAVQFVRNTRHRHRLPASGGLTLFATYSPMVAPWYGVIAKLGKIGRIYTIHGNTGEVLPDWFAKCVLSTATIGGSELYLLHPKNERMSNETQPDTQTPNHTQQP